jgi:sugar (pentulose or hexulose) kinase
VPLLAGLDVGTTATKAVLVDLDGRELAHGRAATPWESTADGTEARAEALLDAALTALRQALSGAPEQKVAGLGVASMAESGVLLDRTGTVLGPVIAWHDTRDAAEVADLGTAVGAEEFARHTGLPLRSQWSLTKHRWLLSRDGPGGPGGPRGPAAGAARRLNIAEWIVRRLGGEEASEQSLASRTGWLDLGRRDWWPPALEWTGIRPGLLPPLATAGTPLGTVPPDAGIPALAGAVLTVAGHDHQAAAIGAGATGPADELDSCGTAEALVRTVAPGLPPESVLDLTRAGITVGWHALPGRWCLLGATEGGLIMQRALRRLGVAERDMPALDNADWRAVLTEVTTQARALHDAMTAAAGPHGTLVAAGGWLRSPALVAVKQELFGPLRRPAVGEAGARGAALAAGVAAGVYADFPSLPAPRYS